jgi:hypothetical protein
MSRSFYSRLFLLSACVLLTALAGCVANGPPFNAAQLPPLASGEARIIVFRQSGALGFAARIPVTLDGQSFVDIPQDGFVWRDVPAGQHELESSATLYTGTARLGGVLQAGRTIYVEARYAQGTRTATGVAWFGPAGVFSTSETEQRGLYRLVETDPLAALSVLARSKHVE